MTTRDRIAGWGGLAALAAIAWYITATDGVGKLIYFALVIGAMHLVARTTDTVTGWLWRDQQALDELVEVAAQVGERTGLRIVVEQRGRRFEATTVRDHTADRGTVAATAPLPADALRAWLHGIATGDRLTREEL